MHVNFISSRNTRETCIYYVWSDNVNPKNENDDECLRWSIISALIYSKLQKKSLKTYLKKLNMKIKIIHRIKETAKILNKTMNQSLLMSYFYHKTARK